MRKPRDYQQATLDAIRREHEKVTATLIVLPTGCGKTVVMAKLAAEHPTGNVLLLAHRLELLNQAQRKIGDELGYLPVIEQAQRGMDVDLLWQGGCVIVGSVQTMVNEKRLAKFKDKPFDLIMIDEAHHATSASYRKVVDYFLAANPGCKLLGVTATPRRADKTALGIVFDSVAYELSILDAVELGWLVRPEQEYVSVDDIDFSGISLTTNDFGESDMRASELESVMLEEEALHALARPILDKFKEKQCLVFTAGVAHAHMLTAVLNRYREGSAKAVDGKTLPKEREDAVSAFARGELQFLANFGVFTEGFDVPCVGGVAMGRPTKSEGLYTQMLGRALRPLDGLVDPHPTPDARRAAIAASAKPFALVLDFVGNSRHKLISSVDILGGNYDVETRELVRRRLANKPGDVTEELKKAKAELALLREQDRRKAVKANVGYSTSKVDPFGHGPAPGAHEVDVTRGGASDAQVGFLVNLGVEYATAARYSKRQASAVIESLKEKRCTKKQQAILQKYGESTDVNFDQASAIIDEIASSGWKPRRQEAGV